MSKLTQLVIDIFSETGRLSEIIPGYRYNPQQADYALHVAKTIEGQGDETSIALLEADAGIGKSIGYLIPLVLHSSLTGDRVAVSTFTLQLQSQLIKKDIALALDIAEELTGNRLLAAPRKGLRNFVSQTRAKKLIDELSKYADKKEQFFIDTFSEWVQETTTGDIREWMEDYGELPKGMHVVDICLDESSPKEDRKLYQQHVDASKDADIVIITHTMLLMHGMWGFNLLDNNSGENERAIAHVVVDEADRIPQAAEGLARKKLSPHMINSFLASIAKADPAASAAMINISNFSNWLKGHQAGPEQKHLILENSTAIKKEALAHAALALVSLQAIDKDNLSGESLDRLLSTKDIVERVVVALTDNKGDGGNNAYANNFSMLTWSPVLNLPSIELVLLNPGRVASRYWQKSELSPMGYLSSIVLTSASLSTPGQRGDAQFMDFMIETGIAKDTHNVVYKIAYEHEKFGDAEFVFLSPDISGPLMHKDDEEAESEDEYFEPHPDWLNSTTNMIAEAANQGGRVLVLANSFNDSEEFSELVGQKLTDDYCLIVQKRGEKLQQMLKRFIAEPNSVLITPSGWEGLDLPGLLSHVVIARLPFLPPDNSYNSIYKKYLMEIKGFSKSKANSIVFLKNINAARRKLKQGMGRGIRKEDDKVTYWFGDPRFPMPDELKDKLFRTMRVNFSRRQYPAMFMSIAPRFRDGVFAKVLFGKVFDGEKLL